MWKFGISSLFKCSCSVNIINQRFASHSNKKWTQKTSKSPKKKFSKQDPDPRRQKFSAFNPDENFDEEDYENEVDIMKFNKLYDDHQTIRENHKEIVKKKIIQQRYFKTPQEKNLSWSDKEHIRYLYNTDSTTWTFEMIGDHFKIDQDIARRIATAKWIPKQNKSGDDQISNTQGTEFLKLSDPNSTKLKPQGLQEMMTFAEQQKSIGVEQKKEEEISLKHEAEPMHNPKNDSEVDRLIQFLSKDHPSVWAKQETDPQSKGRFGRALGKEDEMTKVGDLYQRGDSFYNENGEFLYRVPGIISS